MAKKDCLICGKAGYSYYPFCQEHLTQKQNGELDKCEKCEKWFVKSKGCDCKKPNKNTVENSTTKEKETVNKTEGIQITCIICGENSNGLHFCKTCYYKYKDRAVDIRITNCKETEILDEYGNLKYKCADGHKVRSRAEHMINDFLFYNKIRAVYEPVIYYYENDKQIELHPDFYLPDFDLYLEYNELTKKSYLKSKEYALKIYEQINKKVIIMTDEDLQDIEKFLKPKLNLH